MVDPSLGWKDGPVIRRYWLWLVKQESRPTRLLYTPLRVQVALAAVFAVGGVLFGLVVAGLASWSLAGGGVIGFFAGWVAASVVAVAAKVAGRNR